MCRKQIQFPDFNINFQTCKVYDPLRAWNSLNLSNISFIVYVCMITEPCAGLAAASPTGNQRRRPEQRGGSVTLWQGSGGTKTTSLTGLKTATSCTTHCFQLRPWSASPFHSSVKSVHDKLGSERGSEAIRRAFDVWGRVTSLTFEQLSVRHDVNGSRNEIGDIFMLFDSGFHGDMSPFDGEGGSLAHAYYPGPGIGGDVHFDADESWTLDKEDPKGQLVDPFSPAAGFHW